MWKELTKQVRVKFEYNYEAVSGYKNIPYFEHLREQY